MSCFTRSCILLPAKFCCMLLSASDTPPASLKVVATGLWFCFWNRCFRTPLLFSQVLDFSFNFIESLCSIHWFLLLCFAVFFQVFNFLRSLLLIRVDYIRTRNSLACWVSFCANCQTNWISSSSLYYCCLSFQLNFYSRPNWWECKSFYWCLKFGWFKVWFIVLHCPLYDQICFWRWKYWQNLRQFWTCSLQESLNCRLFFVWTVLWSKATYRDCWKERFLQAETCCFSVIK